jgi:O-acetyl-ADP-ribose deacetylase (regulator of RNase III)
MITSTEGNVLASKVEALVNTVNTVGVMGKGIALMFKEAYPENYDAYREACASGKVQIGRMFVTEPMRLGGPKWIINFPTKKHWRQPSNLDWIVEGLADLRRVIQDHGIKSIALPPLGSGNGGLDWDDVKPLIVSALGSLEDVDVRIFEPTDHYQNVAKRTGVQKLTPARALIAEQVRRYWILGIECSLLEIQKLAYFLERGVVRFGLPNELNLRYGANKFGPYSPRLTHLLNALDGSYLHCHKRLADAGPMDVIWFEDSKTDHVATFLRSTDAKQYGPALEWATKLVDGFESPLGMEMLGTVDWIVSQRSEPVSVSDVRMALSKWPGGPASANRKQRIFSDRLIELSLERIAESQQEGLAAVSPSSALSP